MEFGHHWLGDPQHREERHRAPSLPSPTRKDKVAFRVNPNLRYFLRLADVTPLGEKVAQVGITRNATLSLRSWRAARGCTVTLFSMLWGRQAKW